MKARALLAVGFGIGLMGCQTQAPSSSAPGKAAPSSGAEVAATVDGVAITLAEVDERAQQALVRARQQEYDARKEALDALVTLRILEKEAKARGIAVEQLLKDEVERQVPAPDPARVALIYEQNRPRFGSKPRAAAEAEIVEAIRDRSRAEMQAAFAQGLRAKAQVQIALSAPRSTIITPASAPTLGPDAAPVKIVGFADFQCPYCQRAQGTIDQVLKAYGTQVQFIHRDFPLDSHAQAFIAARAARCAGEQGRYWEYYRSLMLEKGDMGEADLRQRAVAVKIDLPPFQSCLASPRHDAAIREGLEAGLKLGVGSTPTFFVNGQMLLGARPFEDFKDVIDAELRRAS